MALLRETVLQNPFIPKTLHEKAFPSIPQAYFLTLPILEALYGGAAGGGKSAALLAGALQYVPVPKYSAILFRRTLTDLDQAGGLISMSHEWLSGTGANWNGSQYRWTFPSGATLSFGYMRDVNDHLRYKGPPFQYIGFDELTSFPMELQYRFMFGRLRKPDGMTVPLRVRSASNPGDVGHEWVKKRFIDCGPVVDRQFVPARLEDNPGLDKASYEESLAKLDPVTRAQMRHGDWTVRPEGNMFKRAWFDMGFPPVSFKRLIRAWDFAATEEGQGKDPDWTAGAKIGLAHDGTFWILSVIRVRATPEAIERLVRQTAEVDGVSCAVRIEQEHGASGKNLVSHYARNVLARFDCRGVPLTGNKIARASPFSAACERRMVNIVAGVWTSDFIDELCAFPEVAHDDQVDAAVHAYNSIHSAFTIGIIDSFPVGSATPT